jgi:hypothetical protein
MSRFKERFFRLADADTIVATTSDVTIFNWTGTDTTMTPTRVDTATAGTATGNIVFHATDATAAANMQTAIRALAGIYADATVTAGATADNMVITVLGGYDITWAATGGAGVITEAGAAGSDTAVAGKVTYTGTLPIGRFAVVKRLRLAGFNDNSLDVSLVDENSKNVFVKTAIDTSTASADVPYDKYLTADGVAGEDGAAAANVNGGCFAGPIAVIVDRSSPATAGAITLFIEAGAGRGSILLRSTGTFTGASTTVNLGATITKIRAIRLTSSADTSVAPTITDAYSKNIYVKTSTDYTTLVLAQLSHEGVDQAANAVADLLDVVVKSPVTVAQTGLGSGTFKVEFWVEV